MLWLWHRLVATGPFRPLAWEPPYAAGTALEKAKRLKKKKKDQKKINIVKKSIVPKAINGFNVILSKIPTAFYTELEQIIMKLQKTLIAKTLFKKMNKEFPL